MSNALVLQNKRDMMVKKINDFELKIQLKFQQSQFTQCFMKLVYSFYGKSFGQLMSDFDANQLKEFDDLLAHRARPWAICQMFFTFCVPVFGWMMGGDIGWKEEAFVSWRYLHYRRYLKKKLGKDYCLFLKEVLIR